MDTKGIILAIAVVLLMLPACNKGGGKVTGDPVQYPAGWPLAFVTVPDGAVRHEIMEFSENTGQYTEVKPWEPNISMQRSNQMRSWTVGFDYGGTCQSVADHIESQLKGKGWIASINNTVTDSKDYQATSAWYYSPDYLYRIHLTYFPETRYTPLMATLEIIEYKNPVDYFPAARGTKLP